MARRRQNRTGKRDNNSIANRPFVPRRYVGYNAYIPRLPSRPAVALRAVEDRRHFHPDQAYRPALGFSRRDQSRVVLRNPTKVAKRYNRLVIPDVFGFRAPNYVAICIRRKIRKEVIHALKLEKRGAGGAKRRNFWSGVKC